MRELGGGRSDAAFDFLVFGLRIGFEETTVVQPKEREAFIPSMADHWSVYEKQPELRAYNAHERFGAMRSSVWGAGVTSSDSSASRRLRDAVHEYDPASDLPVHVLLGRESGPPPETPRQVERAAPVEPDSTGSRQLAKPPETPRIATTPLAAPTETAAERPEWSRFESCSSCSP